MAAQAWTLRQTLLGGFSLVVVALLVVALLGWRSGQQTSTALHDVYVGTAEPLQELGTVHYLVARNRIVLMDAMLQAKPEATAKRLSQYGKQQERIAEIWKSYSSRSLSSQEQQAAKVLSEALRKLDQGGFEPMATALKTEKYEAARTALDEGISPLNPPVVDAMEALMKLQLQAASDHFNAAEQSAKRLQMVSVVVTLLGLGLGAGAAFFITGRVLRQLGAEPQSLAAVADRVASGDLSEVEGAHRAPTGSVLASMSAMRDSLSKIASQVRSASDSMATASGEIAHGNLDLSSRTEQQASSLEETAASMEELGATVRQNADNARQANQLAQGASQVATQGGEVVTQVVQTMRGIQDSSRRIADIISVIDGIAFQTNILALNAAVEAARAGEQGRGFAVVAGEVRLLAQRSADAAKEIKTLISASVERVESGTALVDRAGQTMQEVVDSIRRVTDIVGEISSASTEQSEGVRQVAAAVSQMDLATQQNAALVEQSAAAADSLRQQAAGLVQAVAVFRI
jgi:methyl-accepting chemotaxis protein